MTGGVGGYEYGVTCPECGEYTPLHGSDDPSEGVECTGCGRTLRVHVAVVEGDGQ